MPLVKVDSPNVEYSGEHITSHYDYSTVEVREDSGHKICTPSTRRFTIRTERHVPKTGLLMVGLGGNNGTTVLGGILANKYGMTWETKEGTQCANYLGSLTQSSTVRLGTDALKGTDVYVPMSDLLPMVHPNDVVVGGWDISGTNMGDAMRRAKVLDVSLQLQLYPHMKDMVPMPGVYFKNFIASNQEARADNVLRGTKMEQMEQVRQQIRQFRAATGVDKVIVLWTANTERYASVGQGLNDTAANLMAAIERGDDEISPSTIYCVASILEGCSYINGSPQNTFVPGVLELATQHDTFIAGDDFKSGQTKMKSVLVDFLVSAGIKPTSIVSYNHLGNNDGYNLSSPQQFRSKEISKSNVVDDMVASNRLLYQEDEKPDHCVVIKYIPYVGDSKRAMDEYTSEIFMGGHNTIVMHNTCEDSLLAAPLIIDLVVLCELAERIRIMDHTHKTPKYEKMHVVLSLLSYLTKAPIVPPNTPVVNALFKQRDCIINIMRACVGLPPDNHMLLEHKLKTAGSCQRLLATPPTQPTTPGIDQTPPSFAKTDLLPATMVPAADAVDMHSKTITTQFNNRDAEAA